ncbi:SAM-dependent methyltransferase [Streptomyces sp. HNM0574]|uniref:SAM-dependent methyltransferase n=1 Tax=Streptomyces sp. HNM0574 TaxID=2714954 RepID=UPI00146A6849|nr:SAM-dependent methyltransferase [Streptomyces sp. HNM0574]NLU67059.1 SAM-dependent methyltransferase [Streptomyces sp. HNM0574]
MTEQHSSGHGEGSAAAHTEIDLSRPHAARLYDFYLGGRTNYSVDREQAVKVIQIYPEAFTAARHNRAFMHRATHYLARVHGMRQWLDIGTGIPTEPNLHQKAQEVAPDARVVYVDNDPIVLTYAQALLTGKPEGRTAYIQADVTDPRSILQSPQLAETLDLTQPVVLSLNALLHFVPDEGDPYGIVKTLMDALPSGSALAISHATPEFAEESLGSIVDVYAKSEIPVKLRTKKEIEPFFEGLEFVDPGLAVAHRWRPEEGEPAVAGAPDTAADHEVSLWAGVAIKP